MWRPPFAQEYDSSAVQRASASVIMQCNSNLSQFEFQACQLMSQHAFKHWKVQTRLNALLAMKAPVDLVCVRCLADAHHRAGYSPRYNKVWMCANRFWNPFKLRRVMVHELVHAFDSRCKQCRSTNLACLEEEAFRQSGHPSVPIKVRPRLYFAGLQHKWGI